MNCTILSSDKISDQNFLKLMIKHHTVTINISKYIMSTYNDDYMYNHCRRLIDVFTDEITLMTQLLKNIPNIQNEQSCNYGNNQISYKIQDLYPKIFNNLKCEESYFESSIIPLQVTDTGNYEVLNNIGYSNTSNNINNEYNINKNEYIQYMIDQQNSAIILSKLVLQTTTEPRILILAQGIILNQEKEIFAIATLNNCSKYNWRNQLY